MMRWESGVCHDAEPGGAGCVREMRRYGHCLPDCLGAFTAPASIAFWELSPGEEAPIGFCVAHAAEIVARREGEQFQIRHRATVSAWAVCPVVLQRPRAWEPHPQRKAEIAARLAEQIRRDGPGPEGGGAVEVAPPQSILALLLGQVDGVTVRCKQW